MQIHVEITTSDFHVQTHAKITSKKSMRGSDFYTSLHMKITCAVLWGKNKGYNKYAAKIYFMQASEPCNKIPTESGQIWVHKFPQYFLIIPRCKEECMEILMLLCCFGMMLRQNAFVSTTMKMKVKAFCL